jgi:G:T-mismatch repair DNA endonuclease (very short patch repair protein)
MTVKKGNTNGKKTWFKKGHQLSKGKNNPNYGKKFSKAQREKISSSLRIRYAGLSDEEKKLFSEAHKGKHTHSQEGRIKLSMRMRLNNPSKRPEVRKILSEIQIGKHRSIKSEFKKGHIGYNKGGTISEDQKNKISDTLKGHIVLEETKNKIREARKKQNIPTHHTKPEMIFENICKKHNLPYKFTGDGTLWIGEANPDFINCNGKKIAIEIFGDYWHSPLINPKLEERFTATYREKVFKKHGWKVLIIWESDLIREDTEKFVLNKLEGL